MKNLKKLLSVVCLTFFLAGILSTGCTRYASQEQLQALEDCKKANSEAEKKIASLKREKSQLEDKIAAQQRVLDKLEKDLDAVR